MSSMFNKRPGQGGGGAPPTPVADNLVTDSGNIALSARQGIVLDTIIKDHEKVIASETILGHVKVDGTTIIIDKVTGIISSTASGGDSVTHAQAILPTTVVDQQTWNIPFSNYKYPDDLLIVTHNSTVVDTNGYTITQNIDGISWDVNIPMNPRYSRPVDENVVFVIMIKGMGTGGGGSSVTVEDVLTSSSTVNALSANMGRVLKNQLDTHELIEASNTVLGHVKIDDSTIKINQDGEIYVDNAGQITKLESYQKVLETTTVGQTEWIIPLQSFDPDNDTLLVSHNTTLLTNEMYEIIGSTGAYKVHITSVIPSEIIDNNVFIIILQNVITDGNSVISGSLIIDSTISYDKLDDDLKAKINSSGGISLPISANDVTETPTRVFVTSNEKAEIGANTAENASQTLRISNIESTLNTIVTSDEKVAMDALGTAGYLSELIDESTIINNMGKLEAQSLKNLQSTINELNFLQGATANIQQQINNLSGVSVFRGVFTSLADLQSAPNPQDGQYAIVSSQDSSDYYFYYNGMWEFSHNTTGTVDIDINSGTIGILNKNRYEKPNATEVQFTDPTGQINATDTNAAVVEVFRFADSLLKGLTQTVGSPLSQTDTLESNLRNFKIWYNDITEAITLKGVSTSPSNNGDEIIDRIKAIPNISITGIVKKKSKINMNAGDKLEIQLSSSISLVDITTTLIEFIPGATGVVVYNLEFDNGDSSNFENNDYIEFDGKMKLKNNFTVEAEKMVWTDIGNVSSFVINKSELQSIYSIDVKLRGDTID